jgi:P4 family phage/plasmid primase-like protien
MICREAANSLQGGNGAASKKMVSAATVGSVEHLARSDSRHAMKPSQWDAHCWQLNTQTGIVNLRSGECLAHDPSYFHTKSCTVGPSKESPALWLRFVNRVTGGNHELQSLLQRVAGYCLTADTSEQALFFLYGLGGNGKGVFLNAISNILGTYARTCAPEVFALQKFEKHPTALAGLMGSRLVTASEIERGAELAESQVKTLTGDDPITARFMRGDFFDFRPTFKMILSGNNKPTLRSVDDAIRRRVHLIPFSVTIPTEERDTKLSEKLRSEYPQILGWMIDGCLAWQREGLNPPDCVRAATEEYLESEDTQGRWIAERAVLRKGIETSTAALFADFKSWAELNKESCPSLRAFSVALAQRPGIKKSDNTHSRGFVGVALRSDIQEEH